MKVRNWPDPTLKRKNRPLKKFDLEGDIDSDPDKDVQTKWGVEIDRIWLSREKTDPEKSSI